MSLTRREREKIRDFFDLIFFYIPVTILAAVVPALILIALLGSIIY